MRILLLIWLCSSLAWADPLQAQVARIVSHSHLHVGAYVKILKTGESARVEADRPFPLASVFKLPILVEIARQLQEGGKLHLSDALPVNEPDKCIGSGTVKNVPDGTAVRVERLIELMETISDNTATDVLFRRIGLESVNRFMREVVGATHTDIFLTNRAAWLISLGKSSDFAGLPPADIAAKWRHMDPAARLAAARRAESQNREMSLQEFQAQEDASEQTQTHKEDVLVATTVDNMAAPADLGVLLEKLDAGQLLNPQWTQFCLGVLARQKYNTRLPKLLPREVRVLHKTGTIAGVVNDAGLMVLPNGTRVVVVVLVTGLDSGETARAEDVIAHIALAAYRAAR